MDDFNDILDSVLEDSGKVLNGSGPSPKKSKVLLNPNKVTKPDRTNGLFPPIDKLEIVVRPTSGLVDKSSNTEKVENPTIIKDPLLNNKLLEIVKKKSFDSELEKESLRIVAEEIAYLGSVRETQYNAGLDTSKISLRRIQSIQGLLEIIAKKKSEASGSGDKAEFDFSSDPFRRVFRYILSIVSKTFDEVQIPSNHKQVFFVSLSKNLENFEQEANRIVKGLAPDPDPDPEEEDD